MRKLVFLLPVLAMLMSSATFADAVHLLGLKDSDSWQASNDEVSCSHYSIYRILKYGYGEATTVDYLKGRIGYADATFDIPIFGLHITGNLGKLNMGHPPPVLARVLRDMGYSSATEVGNASDDQIKDLLWQGIPVAMMVEVGTFEALQGATGYPIPLLHWWVANGYDGGYVYVLDTSTNDQLRITWYDLGLLRYYKGKLAGFFYSTDFVEGYGPTSKIATVPLNLSSLENVFFGAALDVLENVGAHRGSILYFNRPIEASRIVRHGERFPSLSVAALWGVRVVSTDGAIDCPGKCSSAYRIGSEATLRVSRLPKGATLRGWSGPCQASGDTCKVTLDAITQVRPLFDCPRCAAAITPAITKQVLNAGTVFQPQAVEFFHAGFGHYFVSADLDEIDALDRGVFFGWARTGEAFNIFAVASGHHDVCRFFTTAFAPKSSHFYTPIDSECASVKSNPIWQYENIAFQVDLPLAGSNISCPTGTIPLYRLYNNGQTGAPNHRYTIKTSIRDAMIASGFVHESANTACVPQ